MHLQPNPSTYPVLLFPGKHLFNQVVPEQKYFISSGMKARVSHSTLFPHPFLCPPSSPQDKEKGSDQSALGLDLPSWNRLPGNSFPDCLPSIALKYSSSAADVLPGKIPHQPEEQLKQMKMIHQSMGTQAQRAGSSAASAKSKRISYHRGRKQRYLISCFSPVLSFALALTSKIRGKKTISPNPKLNVRSRTDCSEPLPDCLPYIALEWSSSTVVGTGSQVTTIADYLAFCRLLAPKLPSMDKSLRSDALTDHSNARFAFNPCIGGQILQEQMSNLHGEKLGRIPLLQGKQMK